ncbi:hypothetical protein H261_12004 [Paramagnetospirillum caucaseum]|uniref:Uncharacterized protein n=1 Tax=Paramagnetospirillum caucaseum TaxID=1244869 RepID=M2ZR08_9PROT|nr:hypothetical protein [Paramagnetospirillum caucaseum]EME69757.1 hypothetical protein H261_12004 [Paramagnetospirillum caucaseum]
MLGKLAWEISNLDRASKGDSFFDVRYTAFNCAVTAWHISDWAWEELDEEVKGDLSARAGDRIADVGTFQAFLRRQCRALHLCRQIATGSKHKVVQRGNDENVTADLGWEVVDEATCEGTCDSPLRTYRQHAVIHDGSNMLETIDVFRDAFRYWERELASWFLIEDRVIFGDGED